MTSWAAIKIPNTQPRMQRVVNYFNKDGRTWITLACGHSKPLPCGVYDENTKRLCRECAK